MENIHKSTKQFECISRESSSSSSSSTNTTAQSSSQDLKQLQKLHSSRRQKFKKANSFEDRDIVVDQTQKCMQTNERVLAESLAIQKLLSKNFNIQKQKISESFCRRMGKKGTAVNSACQQEQKVFQSTYCALAIQSEKRAKLIKKKGGKIGHKLKKALSSIMLPTIKEE